MYMLTVYPVTDDNDNGNKPNTVYAKVCRMDSLPGTRMLIAYQSW
jgi:hypothetical protein